MAFSASFWPLYTPTRPLTKVILFTLQETSKKSIGLEWIGLEWTKQNGLDWSGLEWIGQSKMD